MALELEELQELVDEACDYVQYGYIEVRDDYSGRGMYGKSVPAVVSDDDIRPALFYAAGVLGIDYSEVPQRIDSMGLGVVIY